MEMFTVKPFNPKMLHADTQTSRTFEDSDSCINKEYVENVSPPFLAINLHNYFHRCLLELYIKV